MILKSAHAQARTIDHVMVFTLIKILAADRPYIYIMCLNTHRFANLEYSQNAWEAPFHSCWFVKKVSIALQKLKFSLVSLQDSQNCYQAFFSAALIINSFPTIPTNTYSTMMKLLVPFALFLLASVEGSNVEGNLNLPSVEGNLRGGDLFHRDDKRVLKKDKGKDNKCKGKGKF